MHPRERHNSAPPSLCGSQTRAGPPKVREFSPNHCCALRSFPSLPRNGNLNSTIPCAIDKNRVRSGSIRHHTVADRQTDIRLRVKKSKQSNLKLPSTSPELKKRWNRLSSVDRARAIAKIQRAGVPVRQIARKLGRSESGLRYLLKTHLAAPKKREIAQHNRISTEKTPCIEPAVEARPAEPAAVAVEAPRPQSAKEGADLICNWIDSESLNGHHGEEIIKGASDELFKAKLNHQLPPIAKHPPVLPEVIIRHTKPKQPSGQGEARFSWYAKWLARWAYVTFEDPVERDDALKQALKGQHERQLRFERELRAERKKLQSRTL